MDNPILFSPILLFGYLIINENNNVIFARMAPDRKAGSNMVFCHHEMLSALLFATFSVIASSGRLSAPAVEELK